MTTSPSFGNEPTHSVSQNGRKESTCISRKGAAQCRTIPTLYFPVIVSGAQNPMSTLRACVTGTNVWLPSKNHALFEGMFRHIGSQKAKSQYRGGCVYHMPSTCLDVSAAKRCATTQKLRLSTGEIKTRKSRILGLPRRRGATSWRTLANTPTHLPNKWLWVKIGTPNATLVNGSMD